MNSKDMVRLAQEAGFDVDRDEFFNYKPELVFTGIEADLERFAALVFATEREACAQLVDHILCEGGGTYGDAIRARGKG